MNRYVRHLYHDLGLKKVIDMDHIKRHYFGSHKHLNHKFIVPLGPDPWWEELPEGSAPTAQNLRNFLVEVALGERDLEMARQELCSQEAFVPTQAFSRLDRVSNGKVSYLEILQFLRDNGVNHISEIEVQNLISFYDMDGDKTLTYDEWIQIFLTCENFLMRQNTLVRYSPTLNRFESLPSQLEKSICNIIELEIIYQRKLESLKNINIEDAYALLTSGEEFNSADVANFLEG